MRRTFMLTLVLLLSAAAMAQQTEVPVPEGLVIPVEIKKTLNPKKVKVGDPVMLEVTKDVKGPDGEILIPRRAKATGRVTQAIQRTKENKVSALSFVVESATWKTGSAKLKAYIAGNVRPPEINPDIRASSNPSGVGVLGTQQSAGTAVMEGMSQYEPGGNIDPSTQSRASTPDQYRYIGAARTTGIQGTGIEGIALAGTEDPSVVTVLVSEKENVVLVSGSSMNIRQITREQAQQQAQQPQQ